MTATRPRRLGHEVPRVFTPPLRELTPETSLGFAVIAFATDVLMIDLHPWQRWFFIHALELLPDNTLRFRTVVLLVARQNGKSLVSVILALFMMYVYGLRTVLGTAQDLDTAEEVWQAAVDFVIDTDDDTEEPIRPDLFEKLGRVCQVNGKKALILKNGNRYKVKSANRRAGRGLSGDVVMLDELREHQTWAAWGSITKTTMARAMALVLCLSNAGDSSSVVLRYLRRMAHAVAGDPDGLNADVAADADLDAEMEGDPNAPDPDEEDYGDSLGIFEWSAPPGCSVHDRDAWAMANPAMNHPNGIAERTIAAAAKTDPEEVFRPEVLCQWLDSIGVEGPFPAGTWEAGRWVGARNERPGDEWQIVTNVRACVSTSYDRATTYIAFAGYRADGLPQCEVVAKRPGQSWVRGWLNDPRRRGRIIEVTGQSKGAPVSALVADLAERDPEADEHDPLGDALPVVPWQGEDLAAWTGAVYDLVAAGAITDRGEAVGVRHMPQPDLDVAAATAVPHNLGDRFVWDLRRSPHDAAPLQAFTGALGLLVRRTETPQRSAYADDHDLIVL